MPKEKKPKITMNLACWPFNLEYSGGGFTLYFPPQQAGVEYSNVCTNLSGGNFNILFPNKTAVSIPNDERNIDLNGEPFQLPSSESGHLLINFPNGGTISFKCGGEHASMDPLPDATGACIVVGNDVTITTSKDSN